MENIAAIDIGSNAIRLVIGEYDSEHHTLRVVRKVRESVRLGKDVFATGPISDKTLEQMSAAFRKFHEACQAFDVKRLRAVATSAMREAQNQARVLQHLQTVSPIAIHVIDGDEEARLIHQAVNSQLNLHNKLAVLLDIGGGSVEVTVSQDGHVRATRSFPLGTVRLLQKMDELKLKEKHLKQVVSASFDPVREFLHQQTKGVRVDFCVGTGGNLETLGKLRVQILDKDSTFSIRPKEVHQLIETLTQVPLKERGDKFHMRADRADVIIPAAVVVQSVLEVLDAHRLVIPAVGLKDGLLIDLVKPQTVRVVIS